MICEGCKHFLLYNNGGMILDSYTCTLKPKYNDPFNLDYWMFAYIRGRCIDFEEAEGKL